LIGDLRYDWPVMRGRYLVLALSLGGCAAAAGPPLVDMTDVNPVTYQRNLDRCEIEAQGDGGMIGPLVAGAIIGGTMGVGLGAFAAPASATTATAAEGYGGAAGAVAGAGVSAAAGTPLAMPPPAPRQTLAQCLTAQGYKVIAPAPN
jgi:hypothetical protein